MCDVSGEGMSEALLGAAFQMVYEDGIRAGQQSSGNACGPCKTAYYCGVTVGFEQGKEAQDEAWEAAADVVEAYFDKGNTVLKFADGTKEKVSYHPEYGYAYDAEKAIMACILKHLVGNSYIKALKKFARKAPVQTGVPVLTHGCCPDCPVAITVGEDESLCPKGTSPIDVNADEGMNYTADDVVNCGFVDGWDDIPDEPGYDATLFEEE